MASISQESLIMQIAELEATLATLDREREHVRIRLGQLRSELAALNFEAQRSAPSLPSSMTSEEKVILFRSLFRGRDDVYPRLWENARTGKKGYAPTCSNEWVRSVCEKPRVKCGECPNQAFLHVTDEAVVDHLQGRHVVGVYPLLKDETCWFLAVDFDKGSWREDVAAFLETCRSARVPVAIERSRSGNGAHAWFFFATPIPAALARKMGCFFITETMARRHELSMESYDRLFPNQDTMPRGGFGNLIALPLQYEARQRGNSVFVNDQFEPYADQWGYLSECGRISRSTVDGLAAEAMKKGQVIGVRSVDLVDDEENRAPWMRAPSEVPKRLLAVGPLPPTVGAVVAQRIFVEKAGLPSAVLNQIKRLAAFQNPEFYKKQSMRLSTALTPRVIVCAEEFPEHIALPRGCLANLESLLRECGIALLVDDQRIAGDAFEARFNGQLTDVQLSAAKALVNHDTGVFVAPPGVGKTVVGAYLVAQRARSTLILVHRQPLLDQWVAQLSLFLGIEPKAIGRLGGGKRKLNGHLDVAMLQSLVRGDVVNDVVAGYGHVIVDECHHVPAVSFERVLSNIKARYVTGLTATPQRRDGHHPIIEMQLGPVRFAVESRSQATKRPFAHRLIARETRFQLDGDGGTASIQGLYSALVANEERNQLIVNDVLNALEEGRSPLVLTERREHLEYLESALRPAARNLIILKGGMGAKQRREVAERISTIPPNEERLVLATGRYIGEGFDDARLDTLFLTLPVSWKGTLVQYAGRLHRLYDRKREVRIFDYVDRDVPMLARMFEKRLRGYRAIGYESAAPPAEYGRASDEPVVEWDETALRISSDPI
ncbi:MAG TPA: DEAD/DEAH box helicase family protein [Terriglobales bacterium]|nr:DEAD/DEAH box helicase family protein [Terriglobales bacterium]